MRKLKRPLVESILLAVNFFGLAASLCVSVSAFAERETSGADTCSAGVILSEMRSHYPTPISVSPDGKRVVERDVPKPPYESTLLVLDLETRNVIKKLQWK